jgi:hypothetical protein
LGAYLDVVCDDVGVFDVFDLFFGFVLAANLECVSLADQKITLGWDADVVSPKH